MFRSIVVGVDGSGASDRALEAACALAVAFQGEVHLVHATEKPVPAGDVPVDTEVVATARAHAAAAGIELASATMADGDPMEEILTIAELYNADLVVTGRRGLGGITGLFAGSTSQKIAQNATCAFLSVK